ncbi:MULTISPECIES: GatB/YqeY domain-containing protein [unclassified Pedobacter]|uniref:GatB/YqeY domain-containing protein n=1 Tax=Pedobacter TaxID=84567 RepID=UPI000B4B3A97|nr:MULTISPECIES: GatB/YqeY domain-containing protein [unclassified Pedobacter]MCX2432435.1 GatB/YqeY domain-containing protein [Pedobacter sp. GR22-10]MCX2583474.1 GatB/YqeY domain-containing protein [Pedobacter sp. MR22-3]OWK68775.1 glutamyl-tRNA amidotransferase [Pedobacter sp. AJM]
MISDTINQEMKKAMLAKDQAQLRGLRAIKAALLLARTEKGSSEDMTEEAELKILQKLIKQRRESADIYKSQNRADLYQVEEEEIAVISQFLPKQLSREEVAVIIDEVIKQSGATSVKDMGKVMGPANQALAGKADGKLIAEIVKEKLA